LSYNHKTKQNKTKQNKYLIILLFCLISQISFAQEGYEAVRTQLNSIFSPLNKSQIPKGILYEYSYQVIDITSVSASDTMNYTVWNGIYYTLHSGRINGTQTLQHLDSINARIENYPNIEEEIQIPVLHYDYNSLKVDAVSSNLLYVNSNKLYDVTGRTQSPYLNHTIFAAAPEREYSNKGTVKFIFRSNLFFQNRGKTIQSIQLDSDNGQGYQTAQLDVPITINYTQEGLKMLKVRFNYTDGSFAISKSTFDVKEVQNSVKVFNPGVAEAVFIASTPNVHNFGRLSIIYSTQNPTRNTANPQLMKPLIVLEGYDPTNGEIAPDLQDPYRLADFIEDINLLDFGHIFFVYKLEKTDTSVYF
jgi:hypothetical protein